MGYSDFKSKDGGLGEFEKDKRRRRTVSVEAVTRTPRADAPTPRTDAPNSGADSPQGERPYGERPAYQPREQRDYHQQRDYQPREQRDYQQRDYRDNRQGGGGWHSKPQGERRSYNPNFSADNKFVGGPRPERQERDFNRWDGNQQQQGGYGHQGQGGYGRQGQGYGQGQQQGHWQNQQERRPYEKKPYNPNRSYTPRPAGDRPYGDNRPSYGAQSGPGGGYGGGNKPYGKKKFVKKPFFKKGPGAMNPGMKPETYPTYETENTGKELRLNRYIAMSGKCSRREADELIVKGEVMVNGNVVTELGVKVQPTDEIRLKGEVLSNEKKVYILMNKPKGFVTSVDDPHAEKTVMDIVCNACSERIYPVGRLDKNSVGVLLLTNDGDLTEKLTHPSHNKKKVYQITLERALTNLDLQRARDGIDLDDGVIIPDAVDFVMPNNRKEIGIEIHSGRNRIVRRIFEELGYGVHKLDRVYFSGLTKKHLKRGQWRFLTDKEVSMLKSGRYE